MTWALLSDAAEPSRFGGKAAGLARAVRAGLPVPPGVAVAWPTVDALGRGDRGAEDELRALAGGWDRDRGLAVRSSAVGEDGGRTSFAGQHLSLLNVAADRVIEAARAVWRSGRDDAALGYRRRMGAGGAARMGVVIQELVSADVAGVLFTRNPVDGADEVLVEASWGLGTAVVDGRVIPDRFRIDAGGDVVETALGRKGVAVRPRAGGGSDEVPVHPAVARAASLDRPRLERLHALARRCEDAFGPGQDIEWAFTGDALHLLQVRPLTTGAARVR